MVLLPALTASLLAATSPPPTPSPSPTWTPIPIECHDASGNPLSEAANPTPAWGPDGLPPPKIRKRVDPVFPRNTACKLPIWVTVQALVTTEGDVCETVVVGELAPGCEPYGEALRASVKKWKFEPARNADNQPVAVYFLTMTRFR